ncbi:hypothetical protein RDV84_00245 [Lysobacter yananisis]|uniref:Uncharacterized protein n=1 Tax=Lysobacter yananisis TaxID=1003114 RepID=A0ABY9P8B6_9GAMM|nr:hypothetical protein [Lysobacter yananisis]WMT03320.1 hypothetical protein RDV84_00245 [Lysobacter yananisis]
MKIALLSAHFLCALLLLTACGAKQQPLIKTELVERPTLAYAELPSDLTEELPAPAPPPRNCMLPGGRPAVCALDGLVHELAWITLLSRANADRATSARLSAAAGRKSGDDAP